MKFSVLIYKIETQSLIIISFFFLLGRWAVVLGRSPMNAFIIKFICKQHATFTCRDPVPGPGPSFSSLPVCNNYFNIIFNMHRISLVADIFCSMTNSISTEININFWRCFPASYRTSTDVGDISDIGPHQRYPIRRYGRSVHGALSKLKFGAHTISERPNIFAFAWHVVFTANFGKLLMYHYRYVCARGKYVSRVYFKLIKFNTKWLNIFDIRHSLRDSLNRHSRICTNANSYLCEYRRISNFETTNN